MSHRTLQVEMHGRPWIIDSIDVSHVVAAVDLSEGRPDLQIIRIRPETLALPPGFNVDRVLPSGLALRIGPARPFRVSAGAFQSVILSTPLRNAGRQLLIKSATVSFPVFI